MYDTHNRSGPGAAKLRLTRSSWGRAAGSFYYTDRKYGPRRDKKTPACAGVMYGEPCWARTSDHRIKSPVLYQLS